MPCPGLWIVRARVFAARVVRGFCDCWWRFDCPLVRLILLCYRECLPRLLGVLLVDGRGWLKGLMGLYSGEPLIEVSRDGVGILSDSVLQKIDCKGARGEKTISATLMTALEGCRASWVANALVFPEAIEEPADNAKRRGSLFHKVMEDFYHLAPEERSGQTLRETAVNVLDSDEFRDFQANDDALRWLDEAVRGYLNVDRDPRRVNIADWTTDWGAHRSRFGSGGVVEAGGREA